MMMLSGLPTLRHQKTGDAQFIELYTRVRARYEHIWLVQAKKIPNVLLKKL